MFRLGIKVELKSDGKFRGLAKISWSDSEGLLSLAPYTQASVQALLRAATGCCWWFDERSGNWLWNWAIFYFTGKMLPSCRRVIFFLGERTCKEISTHQLHIFFVWKDESKSHHKFGIIFNVCIALQLRLWSVRKATEITGRLTWHV